MEQQIISLNGDWLLKRSDGEAFETNVNKDCSVTECSVRIPGSVLSGLLHNQLLEDPY